MKSFKTIWRNAVSELVIQKSKFIGACAYVDSEESALEFIKTIREQHRNATHNCYAYTIKAESDIQRYSDDGEPQGTAGMPILGTLRKQELANVCVVVTRYFGGIKLGANGLVRAYTKSAADVIQEGKVVDNKPYYNVKLSIEYTALGKIENYIREASLYVYQKDFLSNVQFYLYLDTEVYERIHQDLLNLTNGKSRIDILAEPMLLELDGGIVWRE